MKKKKDYLTEYNKLCREAGLTYAQMQQQETMRRMQRIHIPEGYKKAKILFGEVENQYLQTPNSLDI